MSKVVGIGGGPVKLASDNPLTEQAHAAMDRALAQGAQLVLIIYQFGDAQGDAQTGMESVPVDLPALRQGLIMAGSEREQEPGD